MVQKKELKLSCLLFDIVSHTSQDLTAVSTIDGDIIFISTTDGISILDTITHHKESCRRIIFSGSTLLSISSDKSLVVHDVATRKVAREYKDAHESALYAVCEVRDEQVYATGDDGGVIKLWDMRKEDPIVMIQPEHDNFITSLTVDGTGSTLLAASGDGRLSVWNSRQRKLIARSDQCDAELLTCDVVRSGTKVVCADGEGVLNIFSWDDWGDISDRIPVQNEVCIDAVLAYSEDVLLMGCEDGVIRATTLFPHIPLPHVGDHGNNPIEALCLSHDEKEVLSIGHDYVVRAWPVQPLEHSIEEALKAEEEEEDGEEEEEEDSDSEDEQPKRKKVKHVTAQQIKNQQSAEFFNDLA